MIVKFKVASFRETDRIQESSDVYFGGKSGVTIGKVKKTKVWDYSLTDTTGREWYVNGFKKRQKFKEGQTIMAVSQGKDSSWIGKPLTEFEFIQMCSRAIDSRKERIKIDEAEIARIREL